MKKEISIDSLNSLSRGALMQRLRILESVCSRLYLLEEHLEEAVYNPASVRLVYFLLTNSDMDSEKLPRTTHEEIGNQIGAVRQTVSEQISLLRKRKLIQTQGRWIRIINRPNLEKIIQGSETSYYS